MVLPYFTFNFFKETMNDTTSVPLAMKEPVTQYFFQQYVTPINITTGCYELIERVPKYPTIGMALSALAAEATRVSGVSLPTLRLKLAKVQEIPGETTPETIKRELSPNGRQYVVTYFSYNSSDPDNPAFALPNIYQGTTDELQNAGLYTSVAAAATALSEFAGTWRHSIAGGSKIGLAAVSVTTTPASIGTSVFKITELS